MCDRVLVLKEGIANGELEGQEITQENILHLATGEGKVREVLS